MYIETLCSTPEANIMVHVNYILILKKTFLEVLMLAIAKTSSLFDDLVLLWFLVL